jgi:hypothetical protein
MIQPKPNRIEVGDTYKLRIIGLAILCTYKGTVVDFDANYQPIMKVEGWDLLKYGEYILMEKLS